MDKESEKYSKLDQLSKADLEMLSQNNSKNSKNSVSVEVPMDKESCKSKEESKVEGEESKPSSSPS